ncbi:MAG: hypothetical protein H0V29_10400 [Thermoleophilaceae bacterium]|nr:hypothetical protein [Thermoleophilaceae bacterium]
MAQQRTKKKRNPKNRGNAAGVVTRRSGAKKAGTQLEGKALAAQRREEKLNTPPTWRGSLNRAAIAAAIFALLTVLLFNQNPAGALALAAVMLVIYIPMSYYTDLFFYNRRQRQKQAQ